MSRTGQLLVVYRIRYLRGIWTKLSIVSIIDYCYSILESNSTQSVLRLFDKFFGSSTKFNNKIIENVRTLHWRQLLRLQRLLQLSSTGDGNKMGWISMVRKLHGSQLLDVSSDKGWHPELPSQSSSCRGAQLSLQSTTVVYAKYTLQAGLMAARGACATRSWMGCDGEG